MFNISVKAREVNMAKDSRYRVFEEMFIDATEFTPFPYQEKLSRKDMNKIKLLKAPTGAGKTASMVLSWVWRRRYASKETRSETPRRLVYCLPTRVLVEQIYENIINWLDRMELLSGEATWEHEGKKKVLKSYTPRTEPLEEKGSDNGSGIGVSVYKLMGGEQERDWDRTPENDSIIVGTQDMLLSRALNRGYAISRFRWPIQFGLLNNDCLWVMDEVQLMGNGFSTSAQLEAFRQRFGIINNCHTIWMSATCEPEWLETVDHKPPTSFETMYLSDEDYKVETLKQRYNAPKPLEKAEIILEKKAKPDLERYSESFSELILDCHTSSAQNITLVIVNTVDRAQSIYKALLEKKKMGDSGPDVRLIHSRFRPVERSSLNKLLSETPCDPEFPEAGRIIVSTQVVEAGVDISSCVMITELSPWASMVQRFGRLNRYGEYVTPRAIWIDIYTGGNDANGLALPYTVKELEESRSILENLQGVSLKQIDAHGPKLGYQHSYVLRKKDLLDLFDTTPDLSGNDIDVSRFIRDSHDADVQVYWRDWEKVDDTADSPPTELPRATRDELCSVPINSFREFQKKHNVWIWDHLEARWVKSTKRQIIPGQVFLIHCRLGGYNEEMGWFPESETPVKQVPVDEAVLNEATGEDHYTSRTWVTLSQHSMNVVKEMGNLIGHLGASGLNGFEDALGEVALYHDLGKAHPVFQAAVLDTVEDEEELEERKTLVWGKSGGSKRFRYDRKYFRHELASALMLLANRDIIKMASDHMKDLVVYLVAAHHGKVRVSIRSLPKEDLPWIKNARYREGARFAHGIWEGDIVPSVELQGDKVVPETRLKLDSMELGLTGEGDSPWLERMIRLRDMNELGPFRLGYLEAITRISDWRASIKEAQEREAL